MNPNLPGLKPRGLWQHVRFWLRLGDPNKDLTTIFSLANPQAPLQDQILWLARLVVWLRGPALPGSQARASLARLRFLLQLLERHEQRRKDFSRIVAAVISRADASSLFAQTELTEQGGLFSEITSRLSSMIFPPAPRPSDLSYSVEVVFHEYDLDWLESLPVDDWDKLLAILDWSDATKLEIRSTLMRCLIEARANLAIQIAALALTPELRPRLRAMPGAGSSFTELVKVLGEQTDQVRLDQAKKDLAWCKASVDLAYRGIETSGVSLALLYRLENLTGLISRLDLVLHLTDPSSGQTERAHFAREFFIEIIRVRAHGRAIRPLLRMNFDIFARKLVEHAGETGEHYITRTRAEYWHMLLSGGGGGLWMVPSTFLKFMMASLKLPLFVEAFSFGLNYASTFLAMHFTGASLATKQPSMTAAALAEKLSSNMNRERLDEFVEEVMRITRSQFIAAVGNVGFVVPASFLVSWLYKVATGKGPLSATYAEKTIQSLHPWETPSLLYAAMAGVLLWFSSLCAGWLQNLVIYRQLPEAFAHHRKLNDLFGPERCRKFGDWLLRNASGIGGNVSIGFLLAFFPVLGIMLGLPLDIRHITISSASLTVALASLDPAAITWKLVLPPAIGVVLIGVLNVGVSMSLALFVAVRAKKVRGAWVRALLSSVWYHFRKRPWLFFLPPK